jgi:hypothetical protein
MEVEGLLAETADYIAALKQQVGVMHPSPTCYPASASTRCRRRRLVSTPHRTSRGASTSSVERDKTQRQKQSSAGPALCG